MNLKRMLSTVVTVCMIFSLISVSAFAADETNYVSLETYVDVRVDKDADGFFDKDENDEYITESQVVDYAFEGEVLKTVVSIQNATFTNYDIIIGYDNTVVQLMKPDGTVVDSTQKVVDFDPENGVKDVNTLGLTYASAVVSPYHGIVKYAASTSKTTANGKESLVEITFKAIGGGDPRINFLAEEDYINNGGNEDELFDDTELDLMTNATGCMFRNGFTGLALSKNVDVATIYEKPTDIANPVWNEFAGEWNIPADTNCRGYIVELFKDENSVYLNDGVNCNDYDFLSIIKDKANGLGKYKFSVTPLGGDNNATTVYSEVKDVVGIGLYPPTDLAYDPETGIVSWKGNDPEAAGYTVEIYEGEVTEDSVPVKTYTGITSTSKIIAEDITVGDYTIKVKAISDNALYIDSPFCEDPVKYSTGSHVYGNTSYIIQPSSSSNLIIDETIPLTVILKDKNNSQNVISTTAKNGEFNFYGVPNGTYTVTISKEGIVDRVVGPRGNPVTLVLTSSVSKEISKGDNGLQVYLGDIDGDNMITGVDLGIIISLQGALEEDDGYIAAADFFGRDGEIGSTEFNLILANYDVTSRFYNSFDDYDVTMD